jgi:hypothetical protein
LLKSRKFEKQKAPEIPEFRTPGERLGVSPPWRRFAFVLPAAAILDPKSQSDCYRFALQQSDWIANRRLIGSTAR